MLMSQEPVHRLRSATFEAGAVLDCGELSCIAHMW